jgi:hypothetical protein
MHSVPLSQLYGLRHGARPANSRGRGWGPAGGV